MAGDWIKMRIALADDPAVISIAARLSVDEFEVVGMLHHLWGWADTQSRDGHAPGVTNVWIDRYVRHVGFAEAMVSVGWLKVDESGVTFPNFERHNGESAKARALAAERKRNQRGKVTAESGQVSRNERDISVTREEKRREEEKHMSACADEVLCYLNDKAGRKYSATPANTKLIIARVREGASIDELKAVVDMKVSEWLNDPKMEQYLRPATLFNAEKFGQYSGSIGTVNGHTDNPFA
jgi:uncharacterized phage protein (TIGR02220 family)